jgi:hypothetical protein
MDRDLGFAGSALALSVVYYLMADAIPLSLLSDGVGPGGLPKAYAVALGFLSLILMARALLRRAAARAGRRGQAHGDETAHVSVPRAQLIRVAGMLAIGIVYVVVVPWLGYIPTLALLVAATTYYQGGALTRQLAVVAIAGALFFWLLFVVVLHIPQPPGFWPELL